NYFRYYRWGILVFLGDDRKAFGIFSNDYSYLQVVSIATGLAPRENTDYGFGVSPDSMLASDA
ncbi:hypothetical protein, partial [Streptomyces eurythermus]|uniref:hypothetical protein n=1 Tax=Streptomyces eurythermus TaxID=42237 RepID=UPI0033E7C7B1